MPLGQLADKQKYNDDGDPVYHCLEFPVQYDVKGIAKQGEMVNVIVSNYNFPYIIHSASVADRPFTRETKEDLRQLLEQRLNHWGLSSRVYCLSIVGQKYGVEVRFYDMDDPAVKPARHVMNVYLAITALGNDQYGWKQ